MKYFIAFAAVIGLYCVLNMVHGLNGTAFGFAGVYFTWAGVIFAVGSVVILKVCLAGK